MAVDPGTALWLYGSAARGDLDAHSDIDILVVGDPLGWQGAVDQDEIVATLTSAGREVAPMMFAWEEIDGMWKYGSLFLHHVRLEGRMIRDRDRDGLGEFLRTLPRYRRAAQEIAAFDAVLSDVRSSLEGDHSPPFELSVIATALRHAFILGCYVEGRPTFGRSSPFLTLGPDLGLSVGETYALTRLYRFRLYQHHRAPAPWHATSSDVQDWLVVADQHITAIRSRVDEFDRPVPRANRGRSAVGV